MPLSRLSECPRFGKDNSMSNANRPLFAVTPYDTWFYETYLKDFMPEELVDFHTHVYRLDMIDSKAKQESRNTSWPDLVAADNSIEDLKETYRLMFPGKKVTPLMFSYLNHGDNFPLCNGYVAECAKQEGYPALLFLHPEWSAEELNSYLDTGDYLGCKPYLGMAPQNIPVNDICIYDFLPQKHLEVINAKKMAVMLHIPRAQRLRDPLNLKQINEITERYPDIKLIIAHVGRAYALEDIGDAFEVLKPSIERGLYFDISANCNADVFCRLFDAVPKDHIMFGSDLPILRLRTHRIVENGSYINIVPPHMYGDLTGESHMRECTEKEAESITFFMYEEIKAFRDAAERMHLSRKEIDNIFRDNALRLLNEVRRQNGI